MKRIKRMFAMSMLIVDVTVLMLSMVLPFANPLWFIGSFAVIILHVGYYDMVSDWIDSAINDDAV